jgi:hypothetical protein
MGNPTNAHGLRSLPPQAYVALVVWRNARFAQDRERALQQLHGAADAGERLTAIGGELTVSNARPSSVLVDARVPIL